MTRYHQNHWPTDKKNNAGDPVMLCGYSSSIAYKAKEPELIKCPKCSTKYWAQKLADSKRVTIGERIIEHKEWKTYRSIYEVLIDGQLRAMVAMQNGWGKPWIVGALDRHVTKDGAVEFDGWISDDLHLKQATGWFRQQDYHSKEQAAWAAFLLAEHPQYGRNDLPTPAQVVEDRRTAVERRKQREAEEQADRERWAREKAERNAAEAARLKELAEGLESIAKRESLTNFERDALAEVYRRVLGREITGL